MTFTYNSTALAGSPTNLLNPLRLVIGDTNPADPQLQDEEIVWMLAVESGFWPAAVGCVDLMIAQSARLVSKSVGQLKLEAQQKVDGLKVLRATLQKRAFLHGAVLYAGGISTDDKNGQEDDLDWNRPAFRRNLDAVPGTTGTELSSTIMSEQES